jgi:hypothetical protein
LQLPFFWPELQRGILAKFNFLGAHEGEKMQLWRAQGREASVKAQRLPCCWLAALLAPDLDKIRKRL